MNKNIIVVGAIAVGLYLLSQEKKTVKAVAKKKASRRPLRKYLKPHPHLKPKPRVIAKKKAVYNKSKIKKAVAKKKIAPTATKPQKKKTKIKYHVAVRHPKRR